MRQSSGELGDVRDEIVPILLLLQTTKGHLGAGDIFLGILQVLELDVTREDQGWVQREEEREKLPEYPHSR